MRDVRTMTLGEACAAIVDSEHKTAPKDANGVFPLVRTTDLGAARADLTGAHKINAQTYAAWTKRAKPRAGDVILAREAPVGGVYCIVNGELPALGQRTVLLRPDPGKLCGAFLAYRLAAADMQALMREKSTGSTVAHLNMTDIRSLPLPDLPTTSTQQRIVAVLSALDELIAVNERRSAALENLARSLYREWFGLLRFPGHDTARARAGELPSGWRERRLGDTTDLVMGQSPRSEFYNIHGEGLPFHQGVSDYGALIPIHRKFSTNGSKIARKGDLLLSVRAPVGRLNVADRGLILGRGLAALRRRDGAMAFQFEQVRRIMGKENSIGGGTIYHAVNKAELASLQSVEPAQDVVDAFERLARPMLDSRITLTVANRRLASTRDLLLPHLVTGRLDISELDLGELLDAEAA